MMNLLAETIEALEAHDKCPAEVLWVGRKVSNYNPMYYKSTWDDFSNKANFTYDEGYGGVNIPLDLVIVGDGFWLERHEYDGAEWWEYKELPKALLVKPLELPHYE